MVPGPKCSSEGRAELHCLLEEVVDGFGQLPGIGNDIDGPLNVLLGLIERADYSVKVGHDTLVSV